MSRNRPAPNGFERQEAVRRWRNALLSRGGLTTDDVDELQDHLEGVENELLGDQFAAEEAFWLAAHRVGTPEALTREFNSVKPLTGWLLRFQWALLGIVAMWLLLPIGGIATYLVAHGLLSFADPSHPIISLVRSFGGLLAPLLLLGLAALLMKFAPDEVDTVMSAAGRHMFLSAAVVVAVALVLNGLHGHLYERLADSVTYYDSNLRWIEPLEVVSRYATMVMPYLIFVGPIWLQRERERRGLVAGADR